MKIKTSLITTAALIAGGISLNASLVVDWGGDYVSADTTFTLPEDLNNDKTADRGFGTAEVDAISATFFDSATSIAPASGYTGPAFYGGFQAVSADAGTGSQSHSSTDQVGRTRVDEQGTSDQLIWGNNNGKYFSAVTLWSVSGVSLASGSSIDMNITFIGDNGGESVRFMVESAGQWYVSDTASGSASTGLFSLGGTALDDELWHAVTLNDDVYTDLNYNVSGAPVSLSLVDIDWVGFYFNTTNTENGSNFGIDSFEVNAVPEPSTYALLGGLMALGFVLYRRRAR
jgi:hypothetical protein